MKKILKNFRLTPKTAKKLKAYSKETGEDMTELVEKALEKYFKASALEIADEHEAKAEKIRDHIIQSEMTDSANNQAKTDADQMRNEGFGKSPSNGKQASHNDQQEYPGEEDQDLEK